MLHETKQDRSVALPDTLAIVSEPPNVSASVSAPRRRLGVLAVAALIFLVALNLRPAITAVGPVIAEIGATFDIGEGLLGLLGALPLFMFALLSPLTSTLSTRIGVERVIWYALIAIAVGIAIRSLLGAGGLWIGTAIAMGAIAVGNVLVPVIVRTDFQGRVPLATGIYTACMGTAAAIASATVAPIAGELGWQRSLLLWAIPAVIVAVLWFPRARSSAPSRNIGGITPGTSVWRSRSAWWLTGFMGLQSAIFYFMITWLPTIEMEQGVSAEAAGMTLFWYQLVGLTAGLIAPLFLSVGNTQLTATLTATIPLFLGLTGLLLTPQYAFAWSIVIGFGSGTSLVVSLSLIAMRASDAVHTAKLSGMAQSGGYLIAALAPLIAGLLAQTTGSFTPALIMMVGCAGLQLIAAVFTGRTPTT